MLQIIKRNSIHVELKFIPLIILIFLSACVKPNPHEKKYTPSTVGIPRIIIANEGGFGKGNADLSSIDPLTNTIQNELYKNANNNGVLGDVLQSITFKNGLAYCVLNNSGYIKVLNLSDFKLNATANNLNQPRYFSPISINSAIVSSLSLNKNSVNNPMSIISTETFNIIASIPMSGWTEGLLTIGTKTYICNYYKGMLYEFNNTSLQIEDSVKLDYGCSEVIAYKNGQILVLCNGDFSNSNSTSKIFQLDTANLGIIKSIVLNTSGYSNLLYIASADNLLVQGENKIHKVNISSTSVDLFITGLPNQTFYGFGYDEKFEKYYVCDAKDYQQRGQVIVYDKTGTKLTEYTAGYIPSKVYFVN